MYNQPTRSNRLMLAAVVAGGSAISAPAIGQAINEQIKILAADTVSGDFFGVSIDVFGDFLVVGASGDSNSGILTGSAYLFDLSIDSPNGAQILKLVPGDGAAGDFFGNSVAMGSPNVTGIGAGTASGVICVGANSKDELGTDSGVAYLYAAATGALIAKLVPNDGAAHDIFGKSVAIDSGIVAVGAPGADNSAVDSGSVYLFAANNGAQQHKLVANDAVTLDFFGSAVAIGGGVVVVGAPGNDDLGDRAGSAYLFSATTGAQLFKLHANDGSAFDNFGTSVAIDGGIVAVGAYGDDDNSSLSGSVYLFDASTGAQIAKLLPNDGGVNQVFGISVAIDDGIVAVGASIDNDNGSYSGSAYLFSATTFAQTAKLLPSDGSAGDQFGSSIAIDANTVAVGAWQDDDRGTLAGSAYVFGVNCPADLNGDGVIDFFDLSIFLTLYANGTGNPVPPPAGADFTGDGILDFFDVSAFLAAFAAGCP